MTNSNIQLFYSRSAFDCATEYRSRFNELISKATHIRKQCLDGELLYKGFTNLIGDIWFAFYYDNLSLHDGENRPDLLHQQLLNMLLSTEEFKRWKLLTNFDELLSILTTSAFAEQLLRWLQNGSENRESSSIANMEPRLQAMPENVCNSLIAKSVKGAMDQQNSLQFLANINGKRIEQLPLNEQFRLASSLQDNTLLIKIADMTGKFKKIALKKQKTFKKNTMAQKDITLGQEISRLMPAELANYVLPSSKMDFLRKYAEQKTFIYGRKGKEYMGKGPIVICMDESSSMTSIRVESKAFCLALMNIARKQKRDLAVIPFASDIGEIQLFKNGHCTANQLLQFSDAFLGGGTNYEKALVEALKVFQLSRFQNADLIFVTDGSSFLSSSFLRQFNDEKSKRKFECISIVIKNYFNTVDLTVVERFSDMVLEVDELFQASDVFSI